MEEKNANRTIRVFLSSTFTDMMDERDVLMRKTFPILRKIAFEHNVTLTELDLRWGITEEESQNGHVIDLCLREIDKSIPFFVGIVGGRYGWVPEQQSYSPFYDCYTNKVLNYIDKGLSITEMEIQHGVLEQTIPDMHAFFYIKRCQEEGTKEEHEKLRNLKRQIKKSKYPQYKYSTVDELSEMVLSHFTTLLEELFPKSSPDPTKAIVELNKSLENRYKQMYVPRSSVHQKLNDWIKDDSKKHMILVGSEGCGKSAIAVNWCAAQHDFKTVCIHIGEADTGITAESFTDTLFHLMHGVVDYYRTYYDLVCVETPSVLNSKNGRLKVIFESIKEINDNFIFVIDGLDHFTDNRGETIMSWLPETPSNLKLLFTTTPDSYAMEVFNGYFYEKTEIPPINEDECKEIINTFFSIYSKKLTPDQVQRIVAGIKVKNLRILYTLLNDLVCFGRFEELDNYINLLLDYDSTDDFYDKFLNRLHNQYAASNKDSIKELMALICIADDEITESELLAITKVPSLLWSQLSASLSNVIAINNCKISILNRDFKKACLKRYFWQTPKYEKEVRTKLTCYYKEVSETQYYKQLCHQYRILGDDAALHELLCTPQIIKLYYKDAISAFSHWTYLLNKGFTAEKIEALGDNTYNCKQKEIFYETAAILSVISSFEQPSLFDRCIAKLENNQKKASPSDDYLAHLNNTIKHCILLAQKFHGKDKDSEIAFLKKIIALVEEGVEWINSHKRQKKSHLGFIREQLAKFNKKAKINNDVFIKETFPTFCWALQSVGRFCEDNGDYQDAFSYYNRITWITSKYLNKNVDYTVYESIVRVLSMSKDSKDSFEKSRAGYKLEQPKQVSEEEYLYSFLIGRNQDIPNTIMDYAIKALQTCKEEYGAESETMMLLFESIIQYIDDYLEVNPTSIYNLQNYLPSVDWKIENNFENADSLCNNINGLSLYFKSDENNIRQWITTHWFELYGDNDIETKTQTVDIKDLNIVYAYEYHLFISRFWNALTKCPLTAPYMNSLPTYLDEIKNSDDDDLCLDIAESYMGSQDEHLVYLGGIIVSILLNNIDIKGYRIYVRGRLIELSKEIIESRLAKKLT